MARIKYAVVGIEKQMLNNLIGTLARGEVDGEAETIVLPAPVPVVYAVSEGIVNNPGIGVQVKEVPFSKFLGEAVTKERRKIIRTSTGEKVIGDVVEKLATT